MPFLWRDFWASLHQSLSIALNWERRDVAVLREQRHDLTQNSAQPAWVRIY